MKYDIAKVREQGATDQQIAEYLASKSGYDIKKVLNQGADYTQIAEYLADNAFGVVSGKEAVRLGKLQTFKNEDEKTQFADFSAERILTSSDSNPDRVEQYKSKGASEQEAKDNAAFDARLEERFNQTFKNRKADKNGDRIQRSYNPITEAENAAFASSETALAREEVMASRATDADRIASGVYDGTSSILRGALRSPESIGRVADGVIEPFLKSADEAGKMLGIPDWMMKREYASPTTLLHGLGKVGEAGAQKINDFTSHLYKNSDGYQSGRAANNAVSAQSDEAFKQAITSGDFKGLKKVMSDPANWAVFSAQALPSLAVLAASGGSLAPAMILEGLSKADEIIQSEQDGRIKKASDGNFAAATLMSSLGGVFEKYGFDSLTGAIKGGAKKAAWSLVAEPGTEVLQQYTGNIAQKSFIDKNQDIHEGVLGSAMGGAGMSVGVTGAGGAMLGAGKAYDAYQNRGGEIASAARQMQSDVDSAVFKTPASEVAASRFNPNRNDSQIIHEAISSTRSVDEAIAAATEISSAPINTQGVLNASSQVPFAATQNAGDNGVGSIGNMASVPDIGSGLRADAEALAPSNGTATPLGNAGLQNNQLAAGDIDQTALLEEINNLLGDEFNGNQAAQTVQAKTQESEAPRANELTPDQTSTLNNVTGTQNNVPTGISTAITPTVDTGRFSQGLSGQGIPLAGFSVSLNKSGSLNVSGPNAAEVIKQIVPAGTVMKKSDNEVIVGKTQAENVIAAVEQANAQPEQIRQKPKAGSSIIGGTRSQMQKRDDIVGAIMRSTADAGISPKLAMDITGDTANRASKLRGLFKNGGTEDLGDLAELLRVQEGFDVQDGDHLAELLRAASFGEKIYNSQRMQEEAEKDAEKQFNEQRKQEANRRATELGLKKVGGRRTIDIVEAEIAAKEKEISEFEAREERAAIQAESITTDIYNEGDTLNESDLMKWLGGRIDYTQEEIDEANTRALEIESGRTAAYSYDYSKGQAESSGAGRNRPSETKERAGSTSEREGFDLAGQTPAEVRAQEAARLAEEKKQAEEATKAEQAQKDAELKAEIKRRSEAAADDFQLGGNAMDNLAGQGDMFANPEPATDSKKPQASKNTIFTEDAAEKARALLKSRLGQLNSGLDPEMMQAGITLAGYHIESGARSFAAYAKAMIEDLGDAVKPYLKSWYMGVKYDPRATDFDGMTSPGDVDAIDVDSIIGKDAQNEPNERSGSNLERDSRDSDTEDGMGEEGIRNGRDGDGGVGGSGVVQTEGNDGQRGSKRSGESETASSGERGNQSIYTGASTVSSGSAGSSVDSGSSDSGITGLPIEPDAAKAISESATSGIAKERKQLEQRKADRQENNQPGIESIREALPILLPGQQEDVAKTEARFAQPDGYGMLFTNGTGTGKTFTGLGVIKRFANQGKTNILIAAPSDEIINGWQKAGKMLGLNITRLESTNDAGSGIVITTYANLGANNALASRDWDLVVHDEAHYLKQGKKDDDTKSLEMLRAISLHPDGVYRRHEALNADKIEEMKRLSAAAKQQRMSDDERDWYKADETQKKADKLALELSDNLKEIKADVKARQGEKRTRALFLSATPFAYDLTVDWANGYLFDYNEGRGDDNGSRGYNVGSNKNQFFMQHFGYTMRTNKLTRPDAKVDSGLMERQFNAWLKRRGVLSGRMLDVAADYDRKFILTESAIGARIDEALAWFEDRRKAGDERQGLHLVKETIAEKFDYLSRRYLLEAIKAREVIPHVKEHLALGRKVVVFHDYKKGGGFNPFNLDEIQSADGGSEQTDEYNAVVREFKAEFKDLINAPEFNASSPITAFQKEFPGVLLFNGDIPAKERRANVAKFQDDASGPQVILVQSAAGKEGISLHDTTGKHQRVLFNLGQPTQPTTAIQQEGRIYRTGQVTDAIFRYLNTGTNWEKWAFATTIAQRASTAENLGMGEHARALKDAFISGFEESDDYRAGMEGEGKGGKERDRAANEALTEYDRARAFYYGTQKKNSKTKAQEGVDYFATPEPVGLKMVEWADVRPGEKAMEPSAGHGAIARWFPDSVEKTAIEPSVALRSRLAMVFDGKMVDTTFEEMNVVNKFDAIVMNPPFGTGGKMAIEHVAKAATHLNNGGRIVALIPTGPAADKRFEQWMYGEEERKLKPLIEHPTLGPIYRGDRVQTRAPWMKDAILVRRDRDGSLWFKDANGATKSESMINKEALLSVEQTGKRTQMVRPASDLYMVANIKLPSTTFERAGTQVMTRVVVIEKHSNPDEAPNGTSERDLSNASDIGELFDRLEDLNIQPRSKPREDVEVGDNKAQRKPRADPVDRAAAESAAKENGLEIVEHVTQRGKTIRGVIRKDLSRDQAKEIDKFTFKKDGGWFIREEHLVPQNKVQQESAVYNVNEPDQITGDIFASTENAIPDTGRSDISRVSGRSGGSGNSGAAASRATPVLAVRESPDEDGLYLIKTQLVTVGERRLPVDRVNTPAEAAQAFAGLSRYAVEHLDGLVTDKNGKPLAIIGSFKGSAGSASIALSTLVMELARIDGAANLWISHNHPSGTPTLSKADEQLSAAFANILRGSGVEYHGISAVARVGGKVRWSDSEGNSGELTIGDESKYSVPIVEREIVEANPDEVAITEPRIAKQLVREISNGKPGIVFMTPQNRVAAFVPINPSEIEELRKDGRAMKLFKAASRTGATAAIIAMPDNLVSVAQYKNLAGALSSIEFRVLDGIRYDSKGIGATSLADTGEDYHQSGVFYSKSGASNSLTAANRESIDAQFEAIVERMKSAGVLEVVC